MKTEDKTKSGDKAVVSSRAKIVDSVSKMSGKVVITRLHPVTRKPLGEPIVMQNTITDQGEVNMSHLLGGNEAETYLRPVTYMQFGTGTYPAQRTDEVLQGPISPPKTIVTVTFPSDYLVTLSSGLEQDEGNGFPISEVGLLDGQYRLMARLVFDTVQPKDSDHVLWVDWTIQFSSAP